MTAAALMPAPGLVGDRPSRNARCRSRRADEIRHSLGFGVRRKEEGLRPAGARRAGRPVWGLPGDDEARCRPVRFLTFVGCGWTQR